MDGHIAHHNTNPKPFIWTQSARDILHKAIRANSRLSSKQIETLHRINLVINPTLVAVFSPCSRDACAPMATSIQDRLPSTAPLSLRRGTLFCCWKPP